MKQSPSWDANRHTASRVLPNGFCNQKFHYRIHKRPPSVAILSQINPAGATSSCNVLKFHLVLFSHLRLGFPSGLFPSGLPPRTLYTPLNPHPYVLHAPPISFFLTSSPEQYLVSSTDHQTPRYVVFLHCPVTSSLLDPHLSLNTVFRKILSPGICLKIRPLVS